MELIGPDFPKSINISARSGSAISYEANGSSLLFGGINGNILDNGTYLWDGIDWILTPTAISPAGRYGHHLARDLNGNTLLLFGGLDGSGNLLDDTWVWNGFWSDLTSADKPPARAFYGSAFDDVQKKWLLFGGWGNSGYLNDTWEFDGMHWNQLFPVNSPPERAYSSLTYDATRNKIVLIGGRGESGYLDDIWEWDGSNWSKVIPQQLTGTRAAHAAAYDSTRNVVVVAGGIGSQTDTQEWNGSFWRQRISNQSLPDMYNLAMDYDPVHDRLVVIGGENSSGPVEGTYLQQVLGTPSDAPPVATIQRINPRDARQGIDQIEFQGAGADADTSDVIQAYRWLHNGQVLSTQAFFSLDAGNLPLGTQTIQFQVQDDEGTWSPAISQQVTIRTSSAATGSGHTWTLLIYAAADNNLDSYMGDYSATSAMLYRLKSSGARAGVQTGILYDGPGANDTHRYILNDQGVWSDQPLSEARMDDMETLRDFIRWGTTNFQTDYYVLAIADHANGIVGMAEDRTSNTDGTAFLTPIEMRSALQAATDDGAHKLDVVYFDGCSFGLFEDAAITGDLANYLVASPNTGWGVFAYDQYRQKAAMAATPRDLAQSIAATYAISVASRQLPYTISSFDLAHFSELKTAIGDLGDQLVAYVNGDPFNRIAQLKNIRAAAQKYDSGGSKRMEMDNEDSYVDLLDLINRLKTAISDPDVSLAAGAVGEILVGENPFVIYEQHASGQFLYYDAALGTDRQYTVNLANAGGIGVYYPPRSTTDQSSAYMRYIRNQLFDITPDWGWTRFLTQGLPPQLGGDPSPMPNDSLLSPLTISDQKDTWSIFLPVMIK